jgi:hypothetical protein
MEPMPLFSHSDLVIVVLTALGVMLAIFAIVLGIAAVIGWRDIKEQQQKPRPMPSKRKWVSFSDCWIRLRGSKRFSGHGMRFKTSSLPKLPLNRLLEHQMWYNR